LCESWALYRGGNAVQVIKGAVQDMWRLDASCNIMDGRVGARNLLCRARSEKYVA